VSRRPDVPKLVLAGRATAAASNWLARVKTAPLAGRVTHVGYVDEGAREDLYRSARVLVMPSLDEGFGLPALEAMSAGVPVIVSSRGSLPEVVQDAGVQVDPSDTASLADAIERAVFDHGWAVEAARIGLDRARSFTWAESARTLQRAYTDAVARRRNRA
jgi:glycosyltransferase involved in cell wall biosynthesis